MSGIAKCSGGKERTRMAEAQSCYAVRRKGKDRNGLGMAWRSEVLAKQCVAKNSIECSAKPWLSTA